MRLVYTCWMMFTLHHPFITFIEENEFYTLTKRNAVSSLRVNGGSVLGRFEGAEYYYMT